MVFIMIDRVDVDKCACWFKQDHKKIHKQSWQSILIVNYWTILKLANCTTLAMEWERNSKDNHSRTCDDRIEGTREGGRQRISCLDDFIMWSRLFGPDHLGSFSKWKTMDHYGHLPACITTRRIATMACDMHGIINYN